MTDQPVPPATDSTDQVNPMELDHDKEAAEAAKDSSGPPLGKPVFGRYAIFIVLIPFVVYLAGNMFASYVESSRAHTRVKQQSGRARKALTMLDDRLKNDFGDKTPEYLSRKNALNIAAIESKLEAEEFEAEKLEPLLGPIEDTSDVSVEYDEKKLASEELRVLVDMKFLEEDHKIREVLAKSHVHFQKKEGMSDQSAADLKDTTTDSATADEWFPDNKTWYPTTYALVIAATTVFMIFAFPGYFKIPVKISMLSVVVGVLGIVAWVGLVLLDRNFLHLGSLLGAHARDAFDPFKELQGNPTWMWQWMAIRFFGLVIVVPFVEEFFLRGWLMRYIDHPDWDQIPIGYAGQWAILGAVGYGVIAHPGEPLAALVWFGMITWLYMRTSSIWDCVVAHSITNLLLGIYVCYTASWYLW